MDPQNRSSSRWVRSIGRTGRIFQGRVWLWPLVVAVVHGIAGWWGHTVVDNAVNQKTADELRTLLRADVAALKIWMRSQREIVEAIGADHRTRRVCIALLQEGATQDYEPAALLKSRYQPELQAAVQTYLEKHGFVGYALLGFSGADSIILSTSEKVDVGQRLNELFREYRDSVDLGKSIVTRPYPSEVPLRDGDGNMRAGVPTMFVVGPIHDASGDVVGALGFRISPERGFSEILQVARMGETGETYAFDSDGLMISNSRFDLQLREIGLIPNRSTSRSILNVAIRDPGVDLTSGGRAASSRDDQPLTKMAASAVRGEAGVDSEGYRDYRGVPVVGAWLWLGEYGFGVATEVDVAEAYRPRIIIRTVYFVLLGLLAASSGVLFVGTFVVARLQRRIQKGVIKSGQLGQYALQEKLGEGGMGVVYLARHELLRRPTAVKLLNPDNTSSETIERFEREVQLTSQLTHPNTIAIYDYGRSPEGVFYYAMEFVEGMTLEKLVDQHGPQPQERVLHILKQICGSLSEAHAAGLVHRDIKPANLMLTSRGGRFDVVKVLDFGLVKALDARVQTTVTAGNAVTGTPLYLSPEAIESPQKVSSKSDLYAVGAVGFFLLTGRPPFVGETAIEVCMHHVNTPPPRLSEALDQVFDEALEQLLMSCLSKSPQDRPADSRDLELAFERLAIESPWDLNRAESWWRDTVKDRSLDRTQVSVPTGSESG